MTLRRKHKKAINLQWKRIIAGIKILLEELNGRYEMAKEGISELKDRATEII